MEFTVTKEIPIEYGHRVPNHKSKCRSIHGHSGLVRVHVVGPLAITAGASDEGMVIDFSDIKTILVSEVEEVFDHAFVTCVQDYMLVYNMFGTNNADAYIKEAKSLGLVQVHNQNKFFSKVVILPCIPTAENLAHVIFNRVNVNLPKGLMLDKVEFWETKTSCAIVEGNKS